MSGTLITKKELTGFENLLSVVDTDRLDINPYAKRYLQHILLHKKYYCRIYARLINLAVENVNIKAPSAAISSESGTQSKKNICLVDYGAGNGIMGLLAKYAGIEKVFINDINPDFINAAKQLSQQLNIFPDGFIEGDIESVQLYCKDPLPDIIVGTDVIEHIYNLDDFFQSVKQINPAMVTVMSTACNPANRFKVKEFTRLQIKDELHGGTPEDGVLFGETAIEPFIKIREGIIKAHGGGKLSPEAISLLAKTTRGFRKEDIEKAVDKYISHQVVPPVLLHPTNTCDPNTGSWSERLLDFDEYKKIYAAAGFELAICDGFYNAFEKTTKSRLLIGANALISCTAHSFAPFIILVGRK
jgi:2-polyprenyl-3-methyl-5-hydroxy-6-metoxy-1,4-benzoquinol methylase